MESLKMNEIESGYILFKDTEFNDKGKSFFMKIANWITKKVQGTKDKDHTETFIRIYGTLCVASSVGGVGTRIQTFENWMRLEGYPKIEILSPPVSMSKHREKKLLSRILNDLGAGYALLGAVSSKDKHREDGKNKKPRDIFETGIFCSETSGKWTDVIPDWEGDWPRVLYTKLLGLNYYTVFKSESNNIKF